MLYAWPAEGFAYLTLGTARLMLEQIGLGRTWEVAPLTPPLGRGINLQVSVSDLDAPLERLTASRWSLFTTPEAKGSTRRLTLPTADRPRIDASARHTGGMHILLLGGTGFLGRALAHAALDAGHAVTCLARGSAPAASGATFVRADRDDPDALAPVASRTWDAVVDLTSHPAHARDAVHRLTAHHRLLVSTTSVYASFDTPDQAEDAPLAPPADVDLMTEMSQYPGAKRRCEEIYRAATGPVTVIRPGLIGGAGDDTGRSGYYPWRFAHPTGTDVLVPDATFPVSLIDVADLAAWILHCLEHTVTGTFNAAGQTHTLADLYRASIEVTGSTAQPRVIPDDVLLARGIAPWARAAEESTLPT